MSMGPFQRIGLFAKPNSQEIANSFEQLITFLQKRGHSLYLEKLSASILTKPVGTILPGHQIGNQCDLIIVIGGDGSLLKAARSIVDDQIPIVGVNRGRLGFLADISPNQLNDSLKRILDGHYAEEHRMLLNATIMQNNHPISEYTALNDVVLYNGDIARMIEFELFIDSQFVLQQRADGLITSTPTGSTAYALSGGGPILYPTLPAITLVPMFPHALSSRPIVISNQSTIKLVTPQNSQVMPKISCDGQTHVSLATGYEVHIKAHKYPLRLIHPKGYNYYALLREKLGWNTKT